MHMPSYSALGSSNELGENPITSAPDINGQRTGRSREHEQLIMSVQPTLQPHRFAQYLVAALCIFIVSFFAVNSSKTIHNIYYLLLCLPILLFSVTKGAAQTINDCKQGPLIKLLALHLLIVFLTELISHGRALPYLKSTFLLALLWFGLHISSRNKNHTLLLWRIFASVSFGISLWGLTEWLIGFLSGGGITRVSLYASASNPVHGSLLILVGWLGYWLNFGIPKAIETGKTRYIVTIAFVALVSLVVCIVFQSRSGTVGLLAAILTWLTKAKYRRAITTVLMSGIACVLLFGLHEPLMQRGASYRTEIWLDALNHLFADCSIVLGCNNDKDYLYAGQFEHPHSAFLSILIDSGIAGALSFAAFALLFLRNGFRYGGTWFAVSMIGWGGVLTTSNGLVVSPRPLWVYFWIPTFLAMIEIGQRKPPPN